MNDTMLGVGTQTGASELREPNLKSQRSRVSEAKEPK
jgi:hypothetical protein